MKLIYHFLLACTLMAIATDQGLAATPQPMRTTSVTNSTSHGMRIIFTAPQGEVPIAELLALPNRSDAAWIQSTHRTHAYVGPNEELRLPATPLLASIIRVDVQARGEPKLNTQLEDRFMEIIYGALTIIHDKEGGLAITRPAGRRNSR